MFLKGSGCGGDICQKFDIFTFGVITSSIHMSELLALTRKKIELDQIYDKRCCN